MEMVPGRWSESPLATKRREMAPGRWWSEGPLATKRKEMAPGRWLERPLATKRREMAPGRWSRRPPAHRLASAQLLGASVWWVVWCVLCGVVVWWSDGP